MTHKKLSKSIVALAIAGAVAVTGCGDGTDDPDATVPPGDDTATTQMDDMTSTTMGEETTTTGADG